MIEEKWFGKTFGAYGDLTHDFLIKTRGSVKIQAGKQFIELIKNGKINVDVDTLSEVQSVDNINKEGIYYCNNDGSVYIKFKNSLIQLIDGGDSTYVSYAIDQNTSSEQKYRAQHNIGLVFKTLDDAKNTVIDGFVYVIDEQAFYTVSGGIFSKLQFSIPNPYPRQFTIKREETGEGGALKLVGDGKSNGISLPSSNIYELLGNLYISSPTGKVIINEGDKDIITITSEGVTSTVNLKAEKGVTTNSIVSKDFSEGESGFRLYIDNNGRAVLEVDKVIEREANDINSVIRTYSSGTSVSKAVVNMGTIENPSPTFNMTISPYIEFAVGDLVEVQPYLNIRVQYEGKDEDIPYKIPMLFYVQSISGSTLSLKLYPDDSLITFKKTTGKLTYTSEELAELQIGGVTEAVTYIEEGQEIGSIFSGASIYRVAKLGDPEDPTTWLETFCNDYLHNSISLQQNYTEIVDNKLVAHIFKHSVIGNIVSENALDPTQPHRPWNQGIYSDQSVFSGTVFRYPLDLEIPTTEQEEQIDPEVQEELANIIHFPRYSTELNDSLVTYHKKVEDGDIFENVIPTIKWVKESSLNSPLKEINVAGLDETPEKDNSCIAYKDESWQYVQETTHEEFEGLEDRVDTTEQDIDNLQTAVDSLEATAVPVGAILMWYTNTPPTGWLICNGEEFNATQYPKLKKVLGGNTLPNFKGRFPLGTNTYYFLGAAAGKETVALTTDELPKHSHKVDDYYFIENSGVQGEGISGTIPVDGSYLGPGESDYDNNILYYRTHETATTGEGEGHDNMPPYLALNFIIKAV